MEHRVSRVIVQRICDEREELVPYLANVIDSLERHDGLYYARLAEVVPASVAEEFEEWVRGHLGAAGLEGSAHAADSERMAVKRELLERVFTEDADQGRR